MFGVGVAVGALFFSGSTVTGRGGFAEQTRGAIAREREEHAAGAGCWPGSGESGLGAGRTIVKRTNLVNSG